MFILVVDDSNARLRIISEILMSLGFPMGGDFMCVCCNTADSAIEAIAEYQPDVVFLDYYFEPATTKGAKTGADVARWIRDTYKKDVSVAVHSYYAYAKKEFEGTGVTSFVAGAQGIDRGAFDEFIVEARRKYENPGG